MTIQTIKVEKSPSDTFGVGGIKTSKNRDNSLVLRQMNDCASSNHCYREGREKKLQTVQVSHKNSISDGFPPTKRHINATKRHNRAFSIVRIWSPNWKRISSEFSQLNCVPCELVNDRLKEIVRGQFDKMQKNRRKMVSLHTLILKVGKSFPKKFIHDRVAYLPKVMTAIVEKEGGRTKY
jgi:hypothetical protein